MHGKAPYDPVKAHNYYMRTRKLKGRHKGSVARSPRYTVKIDNKNVKLTQQQLSEQKAYAAMRVKSIKSRLHEFSKKLNEMKKKAEEEKAQVNKKPTAADKSKVAREAKKYRERHKQELATKAKTASEKAPKKSATQRDPVAELERKVTEVKGRLKAAINTQRALNTAVRTR